MESVRAGVKPCAMIQRPRERHYLYRAIAEGMEQGWLDLADLETRFAVSVESICQPLLQQWRKTGLVELAEGRVVLTLAGQFWQVNLSQLLQEYLQLQLEKGLHEAA